MHRLNWKTSFRFIKSPQNEFLSPLARENILRIKQFYETTPEIRTLTNGERKHLANKAILRNLRLKLETLTTGEREIINSHQWREFLVSLIIPSSPLRDLRIFVLFVWKFLKKNHFSVKQNREFTPYIVNLFLKVQEKTILWRDLWKLIKKVQ